MIIAATANHYYLSKFEHFGCLHRLKQLKSALLKESFDSKSYFIAISHNASEQIGEQIALTAIETILKHIVYDLDRLSMHYPYVIYICLSKWRTLPLRSVLTKGISVFVFMNMRKTRLNINTSNFVTIFISYPSNCANTNLKRLLIVGWLVQLENLPAMQAYNILKKDEQQRWQKNSKCI